MSSLNRPVPCVTCCIKILSFFIPHHIKVNMSRISSPAYFPRMSSGTHTIIVPVRFSGVKWFFTYSLYVPSCIPQSVILFFYQKRIHLKHHSIFEKYRHISIVFYRHKMIPAIKFGSFSSRKASA